jgi:hypothetical protein
MFEILTKYNSIKKAESLNIFHSNIMCWSSEVRVSSKTENHNISQLNIICWISEIRASAKAESLMSNSVGQRLR